MKTSLAGTLSGVFRKVVRNTAEFLLKVHEMDLYREKFCRDNGWDNSQLIDADEVINDVLIAKGYEYVPGDIGNRDFEQAISRYLEQDNPELKKRLDDKGVTSEKIRSYYQASPEGYLGRIRYYVVLDAQRFCFC